MCLRCSTGTTASATATAPGRVRAIRRIIEDGGPLEPATILARLVAAEHGVWHTGQAGVILGDLIHHASPGYGIARADGAAGRDPAAHP